MRGDNDEKALRERLHELNDALLHVLCGDPGAKMPTSPAQDELDAVALGVNVLAQDLKEELSAQQRLRSERDQIFETMSDALFVCDDDGRVRTVNGAACRLIGAPADDIVGRAFEGLFAEPLTVRRATVALERGGAPQTVDQALLTASGTEVPVHITSSRLASSCEAPGTSGGTVWVARDIRELKRLIEDAALAKAERRRAEELGAARDRLERALHELRSTQEQLLQAQKMEAIGQLAGGIAHDFNNLLMVIMAGGSIAEMSLPTAHPARAEIREISEAARRASELTRRLLTISRRQRIEPSTLALNELVAASDGMLRRLLRENITWRVELGDDVWPVFADAGQVEQVLVNLAVNAADAMPNGGVFSIESSNYRHDGSDPKLAALSCGDYVRLLVRDDGVGMDKATQQHIFEPFFTTKGAEQGSGLGLATCYGIVKQAEGHIDVESTLGVGTCFRILLPRSTEEPKPDQVREKSHVGSGRETILLVEDEKLVRGVTARALERQGYRVLTATDGADAVERFVDTPFDLLITDMIMPRMGGEELAMTFWTQRPQLPVLFVSGYSDRYPDVEGPTRADVLHKPFLPEGLIKAIQALLPEELPQDLSG